MTPVGLVPLEHDLLLRVIRIKPDLGEQEIVGPDEGT
jgi:hypothetical protein